MMSTHNGQVSRVRYQWFSFGTLQGFYLKREYNLLILLKASSIVIKTAKTFSVENFQNIHKVYTPIFPIAET